MTDARAESVATAADNALTTGVVAAFDEARGYGTVRQDGTEPELFFHCTQIVGGSRTIENGTRVRFRVVPGHRGQWEASGLEPLAPSPSRK